MTKPRKTRCPNGVCPKCIEFAMNNAIPQSRTDEPEKSRERVIASIRSSSILILRRYGLAALDSANRKEARCCRFPLKGVFFDDK